jgi:DNA-binding MarR family transcriptional regulator
VAVDKGSERETARALNSGSIHLLRAMRRVDRLSGLTPARLSALSVLVFGGPCSLGRLAKTEGVAGPTMTRIVDGLEAAGLARRLPHPVSARSVLISATDEGTALMHTAAERRLDLIVEALNALPSKQRDKIVAAAPGLVDLAAAVRESADDEADR